MANAPAIEDSKSATPLTKGESNQLRKLESKIQKGMQTFFEVGAALKDIRDKKLYRTDHATFESYCETRWEFSKTHANRQVAAAQLIEDLTPIGVILPSNESQCRPLTKLLDADQQEAWQTVLDRAPQRPDGTREITAKLVTEVVDEKLRQHDAQTTAVSISPDAELAEAVPEPADAELSAADDEPTETSQSETPPDESADAASKASTSTAPEAARERAPAALLDQCESLLSLAEFLDSVPDGGDRDQVESRKLEILSRIKDAALAIADTVSKYEAVISQPGDISEGQP